MESGEGDGGNLNVSAQDKSNQSTIATEKGSLSQSDIDRMVQDEDEANESKDEAENGLENYRLTMRNTLTEDHGEVRKR